MNKRPYTRTQTPRVRFPNLTVYSESLEVLRELQEKTGMSASLLVEMGLLALLNTESDMIVCRCGRWHFYNPAEWGHLADAVNAAHNSGSAHCPKCGSELFSDPE